MRSPRPEIAKAKRMRRRLLELTAEVAIAVTIVIGIALYAIYGPKEPHFLGKWVAFALNTIFVFGYVVKYARPFWAKARLWTVLAGLLLLHALIGWSVISRIERGIPLLWYVPVDLGEIWVVLIAVQMACRALLPPLPMKPNC